MQNTYSKHSLYLNNKLTIKIIFDLLSVFQNIGTLKHMHFS